MLFEYKKNHNLINSYLNNQTIEMKNDDDKLIMGMEIPVFCVVFLFSFILWIFALYILIKHWKQLPSWAQVFGILGLITGLGPLITILVVYVGKDSK